MEPEVTVPSRASKSENPTRTSLANVTARVLGTASLAAIIVIHWLDLPGKLSEVPYLGYAYIALMVGAALAAVLVLQNDRRGWWLGAALALGAILAYSLTRTTGLPLATDDIGNWAEPLGVASLVAEALMVAVSGWALGQRGEVGQEGSAPKSWTR